MTEIASFFVTLRKALVFLGVFLLATLASADDPHTKPAKQEGEDRWVPSLAITSGITIQNMEGAAASVIFEDLSPNPVPLRDAVDGDDLAVSPFVGASLEIVTPAFPVRTRPRLFLRGEILPTFASDRDLALEGDPTCVSSADIDAVCLRDEDGSRRNPVTEESLNGQGTRTSAQIDTLVYGAGLGVSFPVVVKKRQVRLKPFVGWINYKVDATGRLVHGICEDPAECVDFTPILGQPTRERFMREIVLTASDSQRFNGIGPGLDIEVDVGRYDWLGVSLYVGGGAYAILGDRTISFGTSQTYDDPVGNDVVAAAFEVEVDPWMYRANVGIRLQWLGRNP